MSYPFIIEISPIKVLIQGCLVTEQNVNTVLELIQDQLKGLEDFLAKTTSTLHGYDGSEEVKFVQKKKCMCDFSKRCRLSFYLNMGFAHLEASVAEKKTRGLAILLGVSREPRPRPISAWVADLFCFKIRGAGRGDFFTLVRVSSQKAVQCQKMFPVG